MLGPGEGGRDLLKSDSDRLIGRSNELQKSTEQIKQRLCSRRERGGQHGMASVYASEVQIQCSSALVITNHLPCPVQQPEVLKCARYPLLSAHSVQCCQ